MNDDDHDHDPDSDLKRALRTAVRSIKAAQADASSELAVEHLTGAVSQLTFVVGHLTDELTRLKKGGRDGQSPDGQDGPDGQDPSVRNGEIEQDRDRPSRHSTL